MVATALTMERRGVEVADQPRAEHCDVVGLHRGVSSRGLLLALGRPRTRSRPATRARSLAVVAQRAVWLKPQSGTRVSRRGGMPVARIASIRPANSSALS